MRQYLGNSFRPLVGDAPVARCECGGARFEKGLDRSEDRPSNLYFPARRGSFLRSDLALGSKFQMLRATFDRMWSVKRKKYREDKSSSREINREFT